jgi:hypothetical protein
MYPWISERWLQHRQHADIRSLWRSGRGRPGNSSVPLRYAVRAAPWYLVYVGLCLQQVLVLFSCCACGNRQRELARAWFWESRMAPFSAGQPITAADPNQRRKFHVSGEGGFGPRMRYIVCSHKRTGRRHVHTLHGRMCHPAKAARICDAPFHHPLGHSATNGTRRRRCLMGASAPSARKWVLLAATRGPEHCAPFFEHPEPGWH